MVGDGSKERKKTTSGSRLDAREVVVVGDGLKHRKKPPPLAFEREGGGGGGRHVGRTKMTTSSLCLNVREVVVVGGTSKLRNEPPPARVSTQGRWWWLDARQNDQMDHPWLAFGREGGGGGGSRVKMPKSTTSGSRLDTREVVVVAGTSGVVLSWWYGQ